MSTALMLHKAQMALNMTQKEIALAVGSSERTGQRWATEQATPSPFHWIKLAELVYRIDANLAAELARKGETTLEKLGLVKPPPVAPPQRAPTPSHLADSVICAAASALDVTPKAIRPAIVAAFARAAEMGASLEALDEALRASGELALRRASGGATPRRARTRRAPRS